MRERKKGFFIKNIIAIGDQKGMNGEHIRGPYSYIDKHPVIINNGMADPERVKRIVDQIILLGNQAKQNHNVKRLTRLITDEFSFYTRYTPLSLDEYKDIINKIALALKDLPPNIVLIISSFPVLWSDGTMRNAVLHFRSANSNGALPIIHHFSKENFSKTDPYYAKHSDANPKNLNVAEEDCYAVHPDNYLNEHSPDIVLKDTYISCHSKDQYKSAIIVRGLHLPPLIDAIDICLDHSKQVALRNVKALLEELEKDLPLHIGHVISSNTSKYFETALTAAPIQADWLTRQVADVTTKKITTEIAHFGSNPTFYIYHQMRAEILNEQLIISANKINNVEGISVRALLDQHKNTILHQIFLPNKTSMVHSHEQRQLKSFIRIIPYFWGSAINQQNEDGETPLHLAIKITCSENILAKLLDQGARLDIKNKSGKSIISWAYEKNKTKLVELLINELMSNKKVYLNHKDSILSLLNDIEDPLLKKKMAASALYYEISLLTPENIDKNKAIELLRIADASPVRIFIQHNIDQLLTTFKKGFLYYYLVNNDAIYDNNDHIATLPDSLHALLLRLDIKSGLMSEKPSSLYQKGMSLLLHHFTESDRIFINNIIMTTIQSIPDHELNVNTLEYSINYILLKNNQLVNKISSYLPTIQDGKLTNKILYDCIYQLSCLGIVKRELNHIPLNEKKLSFAWSQITDRDFYPEENSLNLLEQMLLHAFKSQSPSLLDSIVLSSLHMINFILIDKITNSLGTEKVTAKKWFYQTLLENELKRNSQTNINVIFFTLTFYFFIDLNKTFKPSVTVLEQLIAKAYLLQNSQLLDRVMQLASINDLDLLINKVIKIESSLASMKSWIYQKLLKNELARGALANINILSLVLTQEIDWHEIGTNHLTLGEELILNACLQENANMLYQIKQKFSPLFKSDTLQKIAQKFTNNVRAQQWLFHETIKNEFKQFHLADTNLILYFIPFCDLTARSGIKGFTIGEHLIAQTYISKCPYLLDFLKINKPFLLHATMIDKISEAFADGIETKKWIFLELIKNEFRRGYYADLNMIFLAVSSSPINLLNCESGIHPFTVGQQIIAQAYYLKNLGLLEHVLTSLPDLNLNTVFAELANIPAFPQAGVIWLNQQFHLLNKLNNLFANRPTPTTTQTTSFNSPALTLFSPVTNNNVKNDTSNELKTGQLQYK